MKYFLKPYIFTSLFGSLFLPGDYKSAGKIIDSEHTVEIFKEQRVLLLKETSDILLFGEIQNVKNNITDYNDKTNNTTASYSIVNCSMYSSGYLVKGINTQTPEENNILPVQIIQVDVTQIGPYTIMSGFGNGIHFNGTGNFNSTGIHLVELSAVGIPVESGDYTYTVEGCEFIRKTFIPDKRYQDVTFQGNIEARHHRFLYDTYLSETGEIWLRNNLGSDYNNVNHTAFAPESTAISHNDIHSYGSLYQWGRYSDGHELINWVNANTGYPVNGVTATQSSTDEPGHNLFIAPQNGSPDWRSPENPDLWNGEEGVNNPCPNQFRVPAEEDFLEEFDAYGINNYIDVFNSPFKFVLACHRTREDGELTGVSGYNGEYWTNSVNENNNAVSRNIYTRNITNQLTFNNNAHSEGMSVRCIKCKTPDISVSPQSATICQGNTANFSINTNGESGYWYTSQTEDTPFYTGIDFQTPALTETTVFWVEAAEHGCVSERLPVTVEVIPTPEISFSSPIIVCERTEADLTVITEEGTIVNWYYSDSETVPFHIGNTMTTETLYVNTTFWVEAVVETETGLVCRSEKQPYEINVNPLPEIIIENPEPEICFGGDVILTVETDGEMVYWYESADATEPLSTDNPYEIENLTQTTTFWVEAESGENCRSERESITLTVHQLPEISIENPNPEICIGEIIDLTAFSAENSIRWYEEENAEIPVYTGETYTVPGLTETTTFYVEAANSETGCISVRQAITVTVNPQPEIALENPTAQICLDETLEITVTTNGEAVHWYDAEDAVTPVFTGNPYTNDNFTGSATLWTEAVSGENCASERLEITVTVNPLPELIIEDESPEICAGEAVVLQAYSNGNIIYWYNDQEAEIPVNTGEIYEIPGLSETTVFWVEAFNPLTGCTSIRESIPVTVNPVPEILQTDTIFFCDSLNNGEEHVDLTMNNITNDPDIDLKYYANGEDLANDSPIGNPAYFPINSSPRVVYVLAAAGEDGCPAYAELTVVLTEAPAVSDTSLEICSPNGFGTYNLHEANENIIDNPQDYTITYHLSYENAKDGVDPLPETYENVSANQTVFARIEKDEKCFNIAEIVLTYNNTFATVTPLEQCDDNSDGLAIFNLTEKEPEISAIFGSSGYIIIYYESLENAYDNVDEIPNPENYTNISNPQTVYAKVYDGDICLGTISFDLIAVQIPVIEIETEIALCPGENYTIEAPSSYESYTWTNPAGIVISTTNSAVLDTEGTYILEITFADNICVLREEIEVEFDGSPVITNIEVNGTTVIVTAIGTAPLEYSIDGGVTWQSSNIFYDVIYGEYEIMVRSANRCLSGAYPIIVFELTNIITPNGDGYNDTWEIPALMNYPGATLKIVNRYGKTLVDINLENGFSWDGKHNGNPLPSTSYWYVLDLGNGQKMTGNITLKNY